MYGETKLQTTERFMDQVKEMSRIKSLRNETQSKSSITPKLSLYIISILDFIRSRLFDRDLDVHILYNKKKYFRLHISLLWILLEIQETGELQGV